jgi:tape measure domain-containing protein
MAVVADKVIVELEAKLDRYDANVRRAEQQFTRSMSSIDRSASRTSNLVSASVRAMAGALAGVSAIALARQFITMVDEAKKLDAQLRLATASVGSFGQAQEDVRRIAEATRSDLSATGALYAAFARNARDLGLSQEQVADITETVGKSFKISGAGASESAQAIRQLTQAFQSGVLRGDEFNSMAENAPRLQRLLADSLGVSVGALRAMAEEGELTADKLARAFSDRKFTAALDAEFREIPVTFEDAMTLVYNSALVTFSEFDRGGGFSQMLAQFVADSADGFGDMAQSARDAGIDIRATFAGLSDAFQPLVDAAKIAFGTIESDAMTLGDRIRPLLVDIDNITAFLNTGVGIGRDEHGPRFVTSSNGTNLAGRFDQGYQQADRNRRNDIAAQGVADMFRGYDVFGNRIGGSAPAARSTSSAGRKSRGGGRAAPRSPLDPEAFAREEAQLNDEILREKQDAALTAEAIADIELQRLQREQAQEAAETQASDKYTAEQKARLVALQATTFALRRLNVVAERDADIAERNQEAAELQRDQRQSNARLEADALEARYRLAETSKERAEIEGRLLSLAEERERVDLEANIAAGKVADADAARADLAEMHGSRREASARDNEGPMARFLRDSDRSRDEVAELAETWVVDELESIQSRLRDSIMDQIGVDDPILAGILDLFIEQVILRPIAERFAKMQAGGGGTFGAVGNFLSSVVGGLFGAPARAGGGDVVGGKMYRVNDGGGIEGFRPAGSGKIIPLGRMRGAGGGGVTLHQTVNVDARGVNPDGFAEHIKSSVRQETVALIGAGMKQVHANIPARMAQFERDGV